eukprot:2368680-Alexandrium_andersonii.AAC.1
MRRQPPARPPRKRLAGGKGRGASTEGEMGIKDSRPFPELRAAELPVAASSGSKQEGMLVDSDEELDMAGAELVRKKLASDVKALRSAIASLRGQGLKVEGEELEAK